MAVDRTFRCFPPTDPHLHYTRIRWYCKGAVLPIQPDLFRRSPPCYSLQDEENPREFLITFDNIAFCSRPITDTVNCSRWYRSIRRL